MDMNFFVNTKGLEWNYMNSAYFIDRTVRLCDSYGKRKSEVVFLRNKCTREMRKNSFSKKMDLFHYNDFRKTAYA